MATTRRGECKFPGCKEPQRAHTGDNSKRPEALRLLWDERAKVPRYCAAHARSSWRMKGSFGIDLDGYMDMYNEQDGCCKICGVEGLAAGNGHKNRMLVLCIDHCHDTGAIRGLLCWPCNVGIGHLKSDPEVLRAAAEYLEVEYAIF